MKGEFFSRYAFPFDTELPLEVYDALNALQLSRPAPKQSVDAVTYKPDGSGGTISYQVLVEAKSTTQAKYVRTRIKDALERQVSNAKVGFIVIDKVPFKDLKFKPEKLKVLDRSKRKESNGQKVKSLMLVFFLWVLRSQTKLFFERSMENLVEKLRSVSSSSYRGPISTARVSR